MVATSQDADGSQVTTEAAVVENTAPGVKKQTAKKMIVERGDASHRLHAFQASQGMHGKWSGDYLIEACLPT